MWDKTKRRFSTLRRRMSMGNGQGDEGSSSAEQKLKSKLYHNRNRRQTNATTSTEGSDYMNGSERSRSRNASHVSNANSKTNFVAIDLGPMPAADEVEEMLERTLDEMAVAEPNKEGFRELPLEKKWEIIQKQAQFKQRYPTTSRLSQNSEDVKSAHYWIRKLKAKDGKGRPKLTPKEGLNLESVFRTSHRDFISTFLEGFGVRELTKVSDYFTNRSSRSKNGSDVLSSIVEAMRLLMDTELGMRGVLIVPNSIRSIAMAMDMTGDRNEITEKVLLLLSVTCWWNEEGRKQVMEAMNYVKKRNNEKSLFTNLVYLFEHSDDVKFQASLATFFTTICNAPASIELRVPVRNYFLTLDLINIFEKVSSRKPVEEHPNPEIAAAWNAITTQFAVFVTIMKEDQKQIVHNLISAADKDASHFDLANLSDSWKLLRRNALKADSLDMLLHLVQALFLVPTVRRLAKPIYKSIAKYIFEATAVDKLALAAGETTEFAKEPPLNFEDLGKLLKEKLDYDAKVEAFEARDDLVRRLRRLVAITHKRLVDIKNGYIEPDKADDLQEELVKHQLLRKKDKLKGKDEKGLNVNISLLEGLGLVDTGGEIEIMKEREEKLKKEIEELSKKVDILSRGGKIPANLGNKTTGGAATTAAKPAKLDSTGLAPAGIAPGKTLKPAPPLPKPGMPGSLELAPFPVDTQASKKKKAVNQKGGLEALFAGRAGAMGNKKKLNIKSKKQKQREALEKLGLPDKPAITPSVKMTQLFWNVVSPEKLEGTIWPELSDQMVKFDTNELEAMFGKQQVQKKKKKAAPTEQEQTKLIDGKRRQNLGIALKKVKMPITEIKKAIIETNLGVLSRDKIQVFINTLPSTDEITLLEKFSKEGGTNDKLPPEEQYLMELSQIPNLMSRLQCIKTAYTFSGDAKRIFRVIKAMKAALKEVNQSEDLREILQIVLAVGNYLNGGTTRGAAWGFKLDVLPKMSTVKDSENNGTLVHYLYVLFEKNYPKLCQFSLPSSARAVDISLRETVKEMNSLAKQVASVKQELKKKPISKHDKFRKKLQAFEINASKDVEKLQKSLEKVRADFQTLALKFAEKGNDCEPKTFFPKLVTFEQDLKRAGLQLKEFRENEQRRRIAAEKKEERLALRKLKMLVEKTKDAEGNLDMGLINAYKQSQSGKANEVVDKYLEKYKREQARRRKRTKKD